jgi:hypothetical protein
MFCFATSRCAMIWSSPFSSVHFFVGNREPTLASSQQYIVLPLCTSGFNPTSLARLSVASSGPLAALDVLLCVALCVVAGVDVDEEDVGAALEAGASLEDCCPNEGAAKPSRVPIKSE